MRIALTALALATVLLGGCRAGTDGDRAADRETRPPAGPSAPAPGTPPTSSTTGTTAPGAAAAGADADLATTDGLLGQLDGPIRAADRAAEDGDG